MPVIRLGQALATLKTHLTEILLKELMGRVTKNGPVIFEDPVAPGEINVIVVWEAWEPLSPDDRTDMIREAYSRHSRALDKGIKHLDSTQKSDFPLIPKVMTTSATTWNEASEYNLLPYSIVPSFDRAKVDPDDVETIMLDAGAFETPMGVQLRLPTSTLASEIRARLMEEMPEANWSILETADPYSH